MGQVTSNQRRAHDTDHLVELMYSELRFLAQRLIRGEPVAQTLQATALVHEAWVRLGSEQAPNWGSKGHFYASAAMAMRRTLIDRARGKSTIKRGGDWHRVDSGMGEIPDLHWSEQFLSDLDDSIHQLAKEDPQAAAIAMLHLSGLSVEEAAQAADMGRSTAFRHWTYARAYLRAEFGPDEF